MKRLVYFLLTGIISLGIICLALTPQAIASQNQDIKVEMQKIGKNTPILIENLQVPVIRGWKNQQAQQVINTKFLNVVTEFRKEMEQTAKESKAEEAKIGFSTGQYSAITQCQVLYNRNDLLGISILYDQYTGGAHGMHWQEIYNIDLRTGQILTLRDIFKANTNYKKLINREIKRQIKLQPDNYFPEDEGGFKSIKDNQSFLIKDNYLVFYFQPYEIACYAAGIVEFKIPFSKLPKLVRERFIIK